MKTRFIRMLLCAVLIVLLAFSLSACGMESLLSGLSPSSSPSPSPSPPDITGIVSGQAYTNPAVGFAITYPKSLHVMSRDEIKELVSQNSELIKGMFKYDSIEEEIQNNLPVSMAYFQEEDGFRSSINIAVSEQQKQLSGNVVDVLNESKDLMKQISANMTLGNPVPTKIAGKDVAVVDGVVTINGVSLNQKQYMFINKSYVVIITLTPADDSKMKALEQIVQTIKFL